MSVFLINVTPSDSARNKMDIISEVTGNTLNRYSLDISSCPYPLDVEKFDGLEQVSVLYHFTVSFTRLHPGFHFR